MDYGEEFRDRERERWRQLYPLLSTDEWDTLEPSRVARLGPGDGGKAYRRESRKCLRVNDAAATTLASCMSDGELTSDAPLIHVLGRHADTDWLFLGLSGEWTFDEIMFAVGLIFDRWDARLYYRWIAVFPPSVNLCPDAWNGIWMDCDEESWYDRGMFMPRGFAVDAFEYDGFRSTAAASKDEFLAVGIEALLVDQRKESGGIERPDFITYRGW